MIQDGVCLCQYGKKRKQVEYPLPEPPKAVQKIVMQACGWRGEGVQKWMLWSSGEPINPR